MSLTPTKATPVRLPSRAAPLLGLAALALLPVAAHAISAGDPNPPKDSSGNYLYPPDNPNAPYDPVTQTGRVDMLGMASPFSGVGTIDGGTGELLDSTHVLTAAHLFGGSLSNPSGLTFSLSNGSGGVDSFAVSSVAVPPGYVGPADNLDTDDSNDLAIVTLSSPVPASFQTYSIYTGPLTRGTVLTLAGYGQTGNGVNGYTVNDGQRRVGEVSADGFLQPDGQTITSSYQASDHTYVFEFYSPTGDPNPAPNYLGGASLGNNRQTTIGGGDSGSPGFVQINGRYVIAAINNFTVQFQNPDGSNGPGNGRFGSGGGGAILSAYQGFIAGADPSATFTAAPEPSQTAALGLGVLGVAGLVLRARRRREA